MTKDYCGEALAAAGIEPDFEKRDDSDTPSAESDDDREIARLAGLSAVRYDRERKAAAKALNLRAAVLDRLVEAERAKSDSDDSKPGHALNLPEPELWPESVNGAELLSDISTAIKRYVVLEDHARDAIALWVVHSYLLDCFQITPRLAIRSPMHRCGKTTLLDVVSHMVMRPLPTANVTASAIFRVVEKCRPTLMIDEADSFLPENEELRGVVNSGHRQGGAVVRTVGDEHEPRKFSTYGACAIALIGKLPATLHDRSVTVDLKRRKASEPVTNFRSDRTGDLDTLARKAARWAADNADRVKNIYPEMPGKLFNRDGDNWRPLLAIATVAGGDWPQKARQTAEQCCAAASEDNDVWLAMLVSDIDAIFRARGRNTDRLSSLVLVDTLKEIEGRPWAEFGRTGKPITQNKLASLLKPLGIKPDDMKIDDRTLRGYYLSAFEEAFARYLAPEGVSEVQQSNQCDEIRTSEPFQSPTADPPVGLRECEKSNNDGLSCTVGLQKGEKGETETFSANALTDDGLEIPTFLRRAPRDFDQARDPSPHGQPAPDFSPEPPAKLEMPPAFLYRNPPAHRNGQDKHPACAQCNSDDGQQTQRQLTGGPVWLHDECVRFWLREREA